MNEIIDKLNLGPLNVLDNFKLIHEQHEETYIWYCETKIEEINCEIEIFSINKSNIQIYIVTNLESNNEIDLLKKANIINLENLGCGINLMILVKINTFVFCSYHLIVLYKIVFFKKIFN